MVIRLVAAAFIPLAADEAYYWMLSKNLARGYYDHPPMFALVIRLGTMIAGDTEFGIRLVSILLVLPMSWAVYRAGTILFDSQRVGATAVILLNVTLMVSIGTIIVSPDVPLMVASSFLLLSLAKVLETGRGVWWVAVGASVGAALVSKYTALFFGPIILIWLIANPNLRHWLVSPWLYLGGIIALIFFTPTLLWNADHHWVSLIKQLGRSHIGGFNPGSFAQMVPGQIAFATPFVFLLGVSGHYALLRGFAGTRATATLINTTVLTLLIYFTVHSLHDNVHPQWFSPIYPAFAVAAAVAVDLVVWPMRWQRIVDWMARWSVPGSLLIFAILIFHTLTGLLNGNHKDGIGKNTAIGFHEVANEIESIRERVGADCVLASYYGTTAWLRFYLPKSVCVEQWSERIRWVNGPEPVLRGKQLFVAEGYRDFHRPKLEARFSVVTKLADLPRKRGPLTVSTYEILQLEGPKGDVFDRSPPPEW